MARTLISRGFDPEKIFTIYNGMDFGNPLQGVDRAAYCKEHWGVDMSRRTTSCAASPPAWTAVKDIATCIRGFAGAAKEVPQLRLFIAGDGEDEKMLRGLCPRAGRRRPRDLLRLGLADQRVFCLHGH